MFPDPSLTSLQIGRDKDIRHIYNTVSDSQKPFFTGAALDLLQDLENSRRTGDNNDDVGRDDDDEDESLETASQISRSLLVNDNDDHDDTNGHSQLSLGQNDNVEELDSLGMNDAEESDAAAEENGDYVDTSALAAAIANARMKIMSPQQYAKPSASHPRESTSSNSCSKTLVRLPK